MKRAEMKVVFAGILASTLLMFQVGSALADTLVSQNLGASHYAASSTYLTRVPSLAFDGSLSTNWMANAYAPPRADGQIGWIEVELLGGNIWWLSDIHLVVNGISTTTPVHETVQVWLSDSPIQGNTSGATLIHTFDGNFYTNQVLEYDVVDYTLQGRYVQFRTISEGTATSTQRPSWKEIEVWADDTPVPEPSTVLLMAVGLGGLALLRRRMRN